MKMNLTGSSPKKEEYAKFRMTKVTEWRRRNYRKRLRINKMNYLWGLVKQVTRVL